MFEKGAQARTKFETSVTIALADNQLFDAIVFLRPDERLIDLLNDERNFIPVKRLDGKTIIVAKTNIVSVTERYASDEADHEAPDETAHTFHFADAIGHQPNPDGEDLGGSNTSEDKQSDENPIPHKRRRTFDPYKTLRVSPDASLEEIRRAYKARIKAVHPDTLSGLDVDDEISRAAILATQKVNHAYQRIVRERQAEENGEAPADGHPSASESAA